MDFRRSILPVALIAVAALFGGCTRSQARRDLARDARPAPSPAPGPATVDATSPPIPAPQPPAEPPVAPPKPDALSGIVPPMPSGGPALLAAAAPPPGVPANVPDSPVVQAEAITPESELDRQRRLERRQERKERREERREERQNPTSQEPPKPPEAAAAPADPPAAKAADADLAAVRKLVEAFAKRYADVPDFEARLIKQEVVKGRQLPRDEIQYRFRQKPLSVYMKVLSDAGQGREVMYVQGQFGNQMHVVTGKGDNRLVGVGYKTELNPDDERATAKSRYRIYEAGFGRTLKGLQRQLDAAEAGKANIKPLGPVKRPEYPYPLEGVELSFRPGDDPLLPKGGKREIFFDPKPESPSYMLPVLVVTTEDGKQVEYYCFDQFKVPANTTDADWNPEKLGKK
jgi:hypothetical protein